MFGTLGGPELFLILVIALIVFGPKKLPEIGKNMGRMIGEFRKASQDFQRTIEDEVAAVNRAVEVPSTDASSPKALPPTNPAPVVEAAVASPEGATVSREPVEPK
jgi:TatA/E family protein of Tat protein translocase